MITATSCRGTAEPATVSAADSQDEDHVTASLEQFAALQAAYDKAHGEARKEGLSEEDASEWAFGTLVDHRDKWGNPYDQWDNKLDPSLFAGDEDGYELTDEDYAALAGQA